MNEDGFDPLSYEMEDGLPVFYIHPAPVSTEFCPVIVFYRGKEYRAQARVRGVSSAGYP
ncbi:MAG: hypothetical protein JXB88_24460 [Spirochaetales bacterium]|nr:hypothetical protein [Spirochaetales bacterium]